MTRRHFEKLAENIRFGLRGLETRQRLEGAKAIIDAVCDSCRWANDKFSKEKFLKACQIPEPKVVRRGPRKRVVRRIGPRRRNLKLLQNN